MERREFQCFDEDDIEVRDGFRFLGNDLCSFCTYAYGSIGG